MLPEITAPPQSEMPAAPRHWRRWLALSFVGVAIVALGAYGFTRQRAIHHLEEAGLSIEGADFWQQVRKDWHVLLQRSTWNELFESGHWVSAKNDDFTKVSKLRDFDSLAPAFRFLKPEAIYLMRQPMCGMGADLLSVPTASGCPALENVDALRGLTSLKELNIEDCGALRTWTASRVSNLWNQYSSAGAILCGTSAD